MVSWCILLCSLELLTLLVTSIHGTNIQVLDSSSDYEPGRVTVRCNGGVGQTMLFRRLGNVIDAVQGNIDLMAGFTFVLLRTQEGYYFCSDNTTNSTEIELVAFPFTDTTIAREHRTRIGSVFHLPCTIPFGSLVEKYSVRWFKGLEEMNSARNSHIVVNSTSAALVFNGVRASDYGNSYYCTVTVQAATRNATRQGATISLVIEEPLQLESSLKNTALNENGDLEFSCVASGLPAPVFQWLVNGEQQNAGIDSDENLEGNVTIRTTSRFSVSRVDASKTGQVTCVARHIREGGVVMASSTANVIVLTNNFQTELIRQEGEIVLRGQLPYLIPGVFSLVIRFFNSVNNFEESIVFDPSLTDTKNINVRIPGEKLPNGFKEFHVQVALKVGATLGPFGPASNQISYDSIRSPGTCNCGTSSPVDSASMTSVSNTIVVAVVVVLIVLLFVAIVILVVGCVFLYNKKVNLEKAYNVSIHGPHGSPTLHRCASHTSCSSRGSRKSELSCGSSGSSVSSSSHGSSRGMDRKDIELGVIQETGEVASATYENMHNVKEDRGKPRDVRDFETMDHRALKQRDELRANYRMDQRAGVPATIREPEPVYPKTHIGAPEPVFPKTHIGAINPIPYRPGHRNRQRQGRDSGSSFEDLEDDFMEITHKSF